MLECVTSGNKFCGHVAGQNQQWQNLFVRPEGCIDNRFSYLLVLKSLYGLALKTFYRFANDLPCGCDPKMQRMGRNYCTRGLLVQSSAIG
ncbi:hypothetical protein SAMN05216320_1011347 [Duganella sp. OV458]|nr:hypothetical protein SAMN05216320_1011347 [Duganella sp. OV458]SDI49611.1 hypothetical protein SAMN05428973_10168 [Duganella sp. OV510]